MENAFIGNFQGTCARPAMHWDLERCIQKPGKTLRDYIERFSRQYATSPEVEESKAVHAFFHGTKNRLLINKLGRRLPDTMKELMDIAVDEAMGEEAELVILPADGKGKVKRVEEPEPNDEAGPSERRDKKKKKDKRAIMVGVAEPKAARPTARAPR